MRSSRGRSDRARRLKPRTHRGPDRGAARSASRWTRWRRELDESRRPLADKERLATRARDRRAHPDLDPAAQHRRRAVSRSRRACRRRPRSAATTTTSCPSTTAAGSRSATSSGHGLTAGLVMMMVQTGVATLVRAQPDAHRQATSCDAEPRAVRERPRPPRGRAPHDAVADALSPRRHARRRRRPHGRGRLARRDPARSSCSARRARSSRSPRTSITSTSSAVAARSRRPAGPAYRRRHRGRKTPAGTPFGYEGVLEVGGARATKPGRGRPRMPCSSRDQAFPDAGR